MGRSQSDGETRRWWRRATSWLVGVVMFALLALAVATIGVPKVMGGMSLTVLTGSMEPGIMPGDIVVTQGVDTQQAANLRVGDVIAFLPWPDDPTLVTHRIIAKGVTTKGTQFTTQGDNNNAPDLWNPVHDYQVRGRLLYTIPKIGWLRQASAPYEAWIIPLIAGLLFVYAAANLALSLRKPAQAGAPTETDAQAELETYQPRRSA